MATEAQIRANRNNASKSTGPRTEAGKARVAANALKHGMTGAGVALSRTDQPAFDARVAAWNESLGPADPVQQCLVEVAVLASMRLQNAAWYESELREVRMRKADAESAQRGRVEVIRAAQRLATDPEVAYLELRHTHGGCLWLIDRWKSMARSLEIFGAWYDEDMDKVLELTGRDPRARHVDPVAMELRAANNAAMLCPTDGGVLRELHEEKAAEAVTKPGRKAPAAEEPLPEHVAEAMYAAGLKAQQEHERRNLPPEEYARLKARRERDRTLAEASREGLKQFVAIQVERLQAWADAHLTTANLDQVEGRVRALFDESEEGARLRRYEAAAARQLHRALRELRILQAAGSGGGGGGIEVAAEAEVERDPALKGSSKRARVAAAVHADTEPDGAAESSAGPVSPDRVDAVDDSARPAAVEPGAEGRVKTVRDAKGPSKTLQRDGGGEPVVAVGASRGPAEGEARLPGMARRTEAGSPRRKSNPHQNLENAGGPGGSTRPATCDLTKQSQSRNRRQGPGRVAEAKST